MSIWVQAEGREWQTFQLGERVETEVGKSK